MNLNNFLPKAGLNEAALTFNRLRILVMAVSDKKGWYYLDFYTFNPPKRKKNIQSTMTKLTKQDFVAIANSINTAFGFYDLPFIVDRQKDLPVVKNLRKAVVKHLSIFCEQSNPNFDTKKFFEACGVYEE